MVGQCEDHWIFYLMHGKVPLVVVKVLFLTEKEIITNVELVHKNLTNAQAKQKQCYNKSARSRKFSKGDQVLIILPTDTNKWIAQWQGPYQVIKKIGNVNYQINMHDRQKRKRIFHVNMLRPWYSNVNYSCFVQEILEDPDNLPLWQLQGDLPANDNKPPFGKNLFPEQRSTLRDLLNRYSEVIQDKPGRTTWTEHFIITMDTQPVRLPPY